VTFVRAVEPALAADVTGLVCDHWTGSCPDTSRGGPSAHASNHLEPRRTAPADHLDHRATAVDDAQHRPARPRAAPDRVLRGSRRRHRRVRRLADRRGQTAVLLPSAGVATALLIAVAVLPVGASPALLVALTAGIGLATPPVGACVRTLLPAVLPDQRDVRAAYAVEASAVELTWVCGPPLALALGELWSTGAALAAGGLVLALATAAFAAQPASRAWRATGERGPRGGSLQAPAMQTLVIVLTAVGLLFGAVEVAVTAAAAGLGSTATAGPLLALWGAGSLVGGVIATRLGGGAHTARGLALVLGALTAGHLLLIPAAGSAVALGAVLLGAGAAIAPAYASVYAMVDRVAAAGTITEAFAWLTTATALGAAAGAAIAGAVAEHDGPAAVFAIAGAAGALAVLVTVLRAPTLARSAPTAASRPGELLAAATA
jgi:predicted MFS family arabinose efflux permease